VLFLIFSFLENEDCEAEKVLPTPDSEWKWIQNLVPQMGVVEVEEYDYYRMRVDTACANISVAVTSINGGDIDIYADLEVTEPGLYDGYTWHSNTDGDDVLSFAYCHDGAVPYDVYFGVTTFLNDGDYRLVGTSSANFITIPLNELGWSQFRNSLGYGSTSLLFFSPIFSHILLKVNFRWIVRANLLPVIFLHIHIVRMMISPVVFPFGRYNRVMIRIGFILSWRTLTSKFLSFKLSMCTCFLNLYFPSHSCISDH